MGWKQLRGKFKLTKVIPVDTNSAEHPQTPKNRQDLDLRHAHWAPTWAGHSTTGCVLTEFLVLRRKSPGGKFSRHSTEQHLGCQPPRAGICYPAWAEKDLERLKLEQVDEAN